MAQQTDVKPVACSGPIMRRTDEHVLSRSVMDGTRSGDQHNRFPMFNTAQDVTPDSDPRWGKTPCDADWPK